MLKKVIAMLVMAILSLSAFAGTPTIVFDVNGQVGYGTEQALSIEKDTSSGNRVKIKYSSGVQYMADSAAWSGYASMMAGMSRPVASPTSSTGLVYDAAKTNGAGCSNGSSYVAWPNVGQPDYIADNCALRNALKQ